LLIITGTYHVYKSLPDGISFAGQKRPVYDLMFYKDLTWVDTKGDRHSQQEIFDKVIDMINGAQKLIVLDMFLFNDFIGKEKAPYRKLAMEVTDALIAQKEKFPEIQIVVITDPINTIYGGIESRYFEKMKSEKIKVVYTRLERLRDSNPVYSSFWRIFIKPFGNSSGTILPNPFGKGRVSIRSYLGMFNFKTNHRKVIICDDRNGHSALITSANPHDGSSAHGNIAVYFKGPAVLDLLHSENAVLAFSGEDTLTLSSAEKLNDKNNDTETKVQVLSERKIKDVVINALIKTKARDKLSMVMFYLSDRDVIRSLIKAHRRGVKVRVLLDPNKDAFGREKNGIPNRQVAKELVKQGIPVRWSDTHGEQSHAKILLAEYENDQNIVILGSANFTRRNLNNLNLETDIAVYGSTDVPFFTDVRDYIDLQWNNMDGKNFSVDYMEYADDFFVRRVLYHWMEATGMSTF
jgi:phosphatidylserine/phosphatidylglycerophosphate/cardiolipin synthase-like enzyme